MKLNLLKTNCEKYNKNTLHLTSGLASVGVYSRGKFCGNLKVLSPVRTLAFPRPNAKPPTVICHIGSAVLKQTFLTSERYEKMGIRHNIKIEQFAKFALSCSLCSHHKANPTPKYGVSHFLALPTHHPKQESQYRKIRNLMENI